MAKPDAHAVGYALIATALGTCGIAWSPHGLLRLQLPERDRAATKARLTRGLEAATAVPPPAVMAAAIESLVRYADGAAEDFSAVPLDLAQVPDFHRTIYAACCAVRWGQTATYGELAQRVGVPGAARAVGQAMGRNPIPVIIPCHRVLASGQRMGGFSAHGGAITKQRLLALEGVYPGSGTPLLPGLLPDGS